MKKRILSFILTVCIIFNCFVFSPIVLTASELSYSYSDHTNMYGAHIHNDAVITKEINEDGSLKGFKLEIDMYSDFAVKKENTNFTSTVDDYYVADKAGSYLIELWGGDGASTTTAAGGAGGYVYGIINLDEGDVLMYTLGGGGSLTNVVGQGGGANGGGGYGNRGSTTVGGGGGYSALFLYDATEADAFNSTYVDSDGHLKRAVLESDRISKYVMIAGGGGGAGSYGTDNRSVAYGGAGGTVGATSGHLSIDAGYDVSGYFYSGLGGGSTDGSGEYAGKGGSYLPGEPLSTVLNWGSTAQPNDWRGTYNKSLIGGAGGAGNYRGGGGGAGFCGGSGGLMSNVILAHGVGGGGGGSSFVGDVFTSPSFEADGLRAGQGEKEGGGGQIHIVYLDESDDGHLADLNIEFARTPYFTINTFVAENTKTVNGTTTTKTYEFISSEEDRLTEEKIDIDYAYYDMQSHKLVDSTAEGAVNTLKFKIPHVSLMPESDGGEGDRLSITLEFVPKSDFAGGNNVPFFVDDVMTCIPVGQEEKSGEITFATHCGYVNVPLNFNPAPVNHTPQGLDPETVTHKVSSLYIDNYATVRDDPSADWRYHFIEEIGTHRVYSERDPDTELDPDGTISPDETTRYYVMLTVKAKGVESGRNFYAKLDEPVGEKTFTGISVISILGTGIDTLNENMVVYRKSVDYVDGKYVLKLNVQSDSSGSIIGQSLPKFSAIEYSGDGNSSGGNTTGRQSTVTIPIDGEYTITLKGGNGGNGGSSNLFDTDGGVGGKGGYVSASYFLKKGTVLRFYAGANAQNSTDSRKGGAGGEASYVAVLDSNDKSTVLYYLVIAAGGGGGGGAAIFSRGKTGIEPNSFNINARNDHNTPDSKETSLDGYSGGSGVDGSILFTGGNPGTASANYVYIAPDTDDAEIIHRSSSKITDASATAAGMGTLTCDSVGKSGTGSKDNLYQYTIETAISKYFDVDSISLTEKDVETPLTKNITYMLDPTASASESNREYTKIVTDIRPTVEPLEGQTNIYGVDYTVNIYLTPRAGFLGGNEVELIAAQKALTGMLTGIKLSQDGKDDFINFDEDRALDYVNVEISDSLESEISLEVRDDVYIFGGDPVIKSSLVKSITLPAIGDSSRYTWEDDYLKLIDPRLDNEALTPDHTTDYTITAGYGPLYEEPYTNVRPVSEIEAVTISKIATVHTDARIDFVLTGVTPDGLVADTNGKYSDLVEFSENKYAEKDYTVDLSLVSMGSSHHHHMPNAITVTVGDAPLEAGVGYTYTRHDDDSASVIIYKEYITANVVITVEACHESFTVTYLYQNEPESEDATDFVLDRHFGEPIDLENDFITAGKTLPTVYDHYKFNWYLGGELIDISSIGTMPKRNLVFTGRYDPVEYTITVNYHKPDGTVTTVTQAYPYNTEYSILSEEVEGYIPSIAVINGIATRDETFDVTYTSAAGKLTIIYIYSDNSEASPTYSESLDVGETYSVDSPAIDGYSPAVDTVSGEMTAEGVTVTVVYTANKYKVTFNPDGGSCSVPDRTVEYDNIYGYNADSLTFEALPVPVKLGATFEGWMLNGSDINANSTVKITEDSELVAKWKEIRFTITVNYVTDLGASVSTKSESLAVGASYSYITPEHSGHTPDKLIVSGTMPAQNTSVTVTYNRNSYTVTVEFKTSDGQKLAEPQVLTVLHGDAYSVTAPEVAGYVPNMNVVDGVVNANNVNVTVYYYSESISVDITWGDMDFTYDRGTWDPVTHSYNGGKLAPKSANNNTVTVTNNTQSQDITVGFDFVVSSQYPTITGKYTATNNANAAALGDVTVRKNGKSTTAYFWIDDNGTLGDEALPENFVAGKCVVIIKN